MTETLNFLLTNRIPRLTFTHFMGWFSRIEQPLGATRFPAMRRRHKILGPGFVDP
jgi:hypothetical protein